MKHNEDNVGMLIMQSGRVELTGADMGIGAAMDARDAILQWIRSQVVTVQIPQPEPADAGDRNWPVDPEAVVKGD